ncbi:hypothetical protein BDN67DRAFT_663984 [Paxillus ammoniavirescens]|nr:hypothetical protein BDN67DRAFT_663984 [Paxillus ammoniavirescens]
MGGGYYIPGMESTPTIGRVRCARNLFIQGGTEQTPLSVSGAPSLVSPSPRKSGRPAGES